MAKNLVARKTFCLGRTSNKLEKKWDCNLKETEMNADTYFWKSFAVNYFYY